MSKQDIIKKVKEAIKMVEKGKKERVVLEKQWETMERRKAEIVEIVQGVQEELNKINTEQPSVKDRLIGLVTAINKSEGFLEIISETIEGNLEDFIK